MRLADDGHRHFVDHAEKFKIFQRFVLKLAVQRRRRSHADVVQQQGVAVRGGFGHLGGADGAPGAVDVFNDKVGTRTARFFHGLAHGFGQVACDAVGGATGGKRHHDGNRFGSGVALRVGNQGRSSNSQNKQAFHDILQRDVKARQLRIARQFKFRRGGVHHGNYVRAATRFADDKLTKNQLCVDFLATDKNGPYWWLRASSMTLPSLGSAPGATC